MHTTSALCFRLSRLFEDLNFAESGLVGLGHFGRRTDGGPAAPIRAFEIWAFAIRGYSWRR